MNGTLHTDSTPKIQVIKSALKTQAKYATCNGTHWVDLAGTEEGSKPIVGGVWKVDDFKNGNEVYTAEWDDIKYITSGRSVWKDVARGVDHVAEQGDLVWIPRGSKSTLLGSSIHFALIGTYTSTAQ